MAQTENAPYTVYTKHRDGSPERVLTDVMETRKGAMNYARQMSNNYYTEYTRIVDANGTFIAQYSCGKRWNV